MLKFKFRAPVYVMRQVRHAQCTVRVYMLHTAQLSTVHLKPRATKTQICVNVCVNVYAFRTVLRQLSAMCHTNLRAVTGTNQQFCAILPPS